MVSEEEYQQEATRITTLVDAMMSVVEKNEYITLSEISRILDYPYRPQYDFKLTLTDRVFIPLEDSLLMANHVEEVSRGSVLEIGCGTGMQSFLAAQHVAQVYANDINPHAVRLTQHNAQLNGIDNMVVEEGDITAQYDTAFDVIIANLPYLPTSVPKKVGGEVDSAVYGGEDGNQYIFQLIDNLPRLLTEQGSVLLGYCSFNNPDAIQHYAHTRGYQLQEIESSPFGILKDEYLYVGKITKL